MQWMEKLGDVQVGCTHWSEANTSDAHLQGIKGLVQGELKYRASLMLRDIR